MSPVVLFAVVLLALAALLGGSAVYWAVREARLDRAAGPRRGNAQRGVRS